MDRGDPVRGTYAEVSVDVSNTCLIDTEYLPIVYNFNVGEEDGVMYLRIPGYFHADFCKQFTGMLSWYGVHNKTSQRNIYTCTLPDDDNDVLFIIDV